MPPARLGRPTLPPRPLALLAWTYWAALSVGRAALPGLPRVYGPFMLACGGLAVGRRAWATRASTRLWAELGGSGMYLLCCFSLFC